MPPAIPAAPAPAPTPRPRRKAPALLAAAGALGLAALALAGAAEALPEIAEVRALDALLSERNQTLRFEVRLAAGSDDVEGVTFGIPTTADHILGIDTGAPEGWVPSPPETVSNFPVSRCAPVTETQCSVIRFDGPSNPLAAGQTYEFTIRVIAKEANADTSQDWQVTVLDDDTTVNNEDTAIAPVVRYAMGIKSVQPVSPGGATSGVVTAGQHIDLTITVTNDRNTQQTPKLVIRSSNPQDPVETKFPNTFTIARNTNLSLDFATYGLSYNFTANTTSSALGKRTLNISLSGIGNNVPLFLEYDLKKPADVINANTKTDWDQPSCAPAGFRRSPEGASSALLSAQGGAGRAPDRTAHLRAVVENLGGVEATDVAPSLALVRVSSGTDETSSFNVTLLGQPITVPPGSQRTLCFRIEAGEGLALDGAYDVRLRVGHTDPNTRVTLPGGAAGPVTTETLLLPAALTVDSAAPSVRVVSAPARGEFGHALEVIAEVQDAHPAQGSILLDVTPPFGFSRSVPMVPLGGHAYRAVVDAGSLAQLGTHALAVHASDAANNPAAPARAWVTVADATAPAVTEAGLAPTGAPGEVRVRARIADLHGVVKAELLLPAPLNASLALREGDPRAGTWSAALRLPPGQHALRIVARDASGNEGASQILEAIVDRSGAMQVNDFEAPVTEAQLLGQAGDAGWWRGEVTALLLARDASGVRSQHTALDGVAQADPAKVRIAGDGAHGLRFHAVDIGGNAEAPREITVRIDATPPATNVALRGDRGEAGWWRSDVEVRLRATDATSGVAATRASLDGVAADPGGFAVHGDGLHVVRAASRDVAGNAEPEQARVVAIDAMPPAAAILDLEPGTVYVLGEPAATADPLAVPVVVGDKDVTVRAADATSGVEAVELWVDGVLRAAAQPGNGMGNRSGEVVLRWAAADEPAGHHVVEVRVRDRAGNVGVDAREVLVAPASPAGAAATAQDCGHLLAPEPCGALLAAQDPAALCAAAAPGLAPCEALATTPQQACEAALAQGVCRAVLATVEGLAAPDSAGRSG